MLQTHFALEIDLGYIKINTRPAEVQVDPSMMDLSVFVSASFEGLFEQLHAYEREGEGVRKRETEEKGQKDRTNVTD